VQQKRYRFRDQVMRVWVRIHGRAVPAGPEELGREVQAYAAARLPDLVGPLAAV